MGKYKETLGLPSKPMWWVTLKRSQTKGWGGCVACAVNLPDAAGQRWVPLCLAKTKHCIPQWEPHTNGQAWWLSCDGLEMLYCLRIWATCLNIEGTMNYSLYQRILQENVRTSVWKLKLKRSWVMQQDNDPKYTWKWLKKIKNWSFGITWSKSRPNLDWDVVAGLETSNPCLKPHKCHWVTAVLHGKVGQNSSTLTWETDQWLQEAFGWCHCN
jgi:hypothetical protein